MVDIDPGSTPLDSSRRCFTPRCSGQESSQRTSVEFLADPFRGQHAAAVVAVAPDGILIEFAQV